MRPRQNKSLATLHPPAINPQLEELGAITRSAECLQHFILSTEYWLSPRGRLRWWIKINLSLCAWLFMPAVFLMPIVSVVLHEMDGCLAILARIVLKVIFLTALVSVAVLVIKHFPSSSEGSSRRRK